MKEKAKFILIVVLIFVIFIFLISSYFGKEIEEDILDETGGEEELEYLSEGLIGYYKFDNNAEDYSEKGNNGKIMGAEDVNGKIDRALEFGGDIEHDYVNLEQKEFLLQEFTLMAWVKPLNIKGKRSIISKYDEWFSLQLDEGKVSLSGKYPWNEKVLSKEIVEENQWVHVAAIRDVNGSVFVFVNGKGSGSGSLEDLKTGKQIEPLAIGSYNSGWQYNFEGRIDEVRVYEKVLSAEEISKIYKINELKSSGITGAVIRSLRRIFSS